MKKFNNFYVALVGASVVAVSILGMGVANAQSVPQINSGTASAVAAPMVQTLIDGLVWFWTNLGSTIMWLLLIGAVVGAIYRRIHYGKIF